MKTVFPDWADTAFRVALAGIVIVATIAAIAPMIYVRTPFHQRREYPVDQPVQFDHRHHVRDDGVDCLYCHSTATKTRYAGIPATEVCMGCHNQVWPGSIALEPVRRSYFSGQPLKWQRVHELPGYVYFDHSIHLHKGVGCVTCHGRVDEMGLVYQVAPLSMGWCLDCHRNPAPHLRPREEITNMTWQPPSERFGQQLAAMYDARPSTNCTTCHR